MVSYYPEKPPSLQRFRTASSGPVGSMNASIVLDQTLSTFTNLDTLTGYVVIRATNSVTVSSINVKLEGESRTRLVPPPSPQNNERPRPQLEFHKVGQTSQFVSWSGFMNRDLT